MKRRAFLTGITSSALLGATDPSFALDQTDRSHWMSRKWGMMVHWIAPGPVPLVGPRITDLNEAVDKFQLDHFLEQFEKSGASWIIFTIGQNTSYYASPNAYFDSIVGKGHCSNRDLVGEMITGVNKQGRRSILYLPGEIRAPSVLHKPFAWNPEDQSEFETRYANFIREYAVRFDRRCDGWWIDGCYNWDAFRQSKRHWSVWFEAFRAGNDQAAVALNDGSFVAKHFNPLTIEQDFLAGECNSVKDGQIVAGSGWSSSLFLPQSGTMGTPPRKFHLLLPIDCGGQWGHSNANGFLPPLYSDAELFPVVEHCLGVGGGVTFNVGISQEGLISDATVSQLQRLGR